MKGNSIIYDRNISREGIEALASSLREFSGDKRVLINSNGGEFEFFSTLGPALTQQRFTSVALDVCSAANALYLLGSLRYVVPESRFFFHEVRAVSFDGCSITICDVERALDFEKEIRSERCEHAEDLLRGMKNAQSWLIQFMSRQAGIDPHILLRLMRAEAVLTAREAIRYGIAHKLVSLDYLLEGQPGRFLKR